MKNIQKGFTLVELLVVVAIIGLLAGIAIVSVNSVRIKARDTRRIADVKQIQNALELYNNEKGGLYPQATATKELGDAGITVISTNGFAAGDPTFLNVVPKDPTNNGEFQYQYLACGTEGDATKPCLNYQINFATEGVTSLGALGNYKATPTGISGR
ncbi:MAG: prepilin-type N-terminal cleavage/methylation domain-containing protein [Patescibacteria group bacterium]